ncbi:tRNA (cytosine(32)/uridine(32)-2'-O)-methyltransferase TrmJ [Spongiibacter sp. KMU-158]|uniref:tRNA (cytidine/uridine-2'-O-)-methyltransferase TrmJ n=1 Tax=Spongiibacter pelagi TaxID=2760804 RepID=A0A927GV39_9GAMM|nr:tRNA (cytosine(32)/uridine(32)-2'-O)-methyltransferase TrmJ [Spongiibacter pelagi]MBD2858271.1 tRNA (cytosine(32)/uridine(32)-2'-O)-methyltransferase TrmJ [Spongiibacter pelagi]
MTDSTALDNIRIVLVNTSHPGNIGAVARAMKNMCLSRLYLVAPKKFPHDEALWRSANAEDVLEKAVVVETLGEAIADCQLVIGTSARERTVPWPLLDPRHCMGQALAEADAGCEVALVFGREDRGLTNEELQRCNLHVHIPANPEYSSLNLGMAVQVLTYELRMQLLAESLDGNAMQGWDQPPAGNEAMERYLVHLEETLKDLEFLRPEAPKKLMTRLRRLYQRTRLDEMEVNLLRGILTSTQQWVGKAKAQQEQKNAD